MGMFADGGKSLVNYAASGFRVRGILLRSTGMLAGGVNKSTVFYCVGFPRECKYTAFCGYVGGRVEKSTEL